MISSGLSADLNSRVIPPLGHPSPHPSPAGPGRARRILTPTTGHETRLGQKAAKEGKPGSGSRWLGLPSAVEPTRNQKNHFGTLGQPHLCELPPFLPLLSLSTSRHPPRIPCSRPPFAFFRAPTARAGALCRRDQSPSRAVSPGALPGSPWLSLRSRAGNADFRSWLFTTRHYEAVCVVSRFLAS